MGFLQYVHSECPSVFQETLLSVATWLESHPKEIVIFACSHFEGIDDRLHQAFIFSLKKLFGSKLCPQRVSLLNAQLLYGVKTVPNLTSPPQESVLTLRHLWASGYQVILSYDSQSAEEHEELWPAIPYWWANQRTAQGVIKCMDDQKFLGRPGWVPPIFQPTSFLSLWSFLVTKHTHILFFSFTESFFVCGLNLTANRRYIAENRKQSLRTLTFSNWECLRQWLEAQTPGSDPDCLNIIAGDFVGPLPLCSLVIALNQKLLWKKGLR